jgi:hypothetical protein
MKIVHIITRLIIGGAQENTLLSCQGQHQSGHQVTLLTGLQRAIEMAGPQKINDLTIKNPRTLISE